MYCSLALRQDLGDGLHLELKLYLQWSFEVVKVISGGQDAFFFFFRIIEWFMLEKK